MKKRENGANELQKDGISFEFLAKNRESRKIILKKLPQIKLGRCNGGF